MTFKSTGHILYQAVDTEKLAYRAPIKSVGATIRELFVTHDVDAALNGKADGFRNFPMVETEKLIAIWDAGYLIRASLLGNDVKKPDLEKLKNLDEVWSICIRKPLSWQLRILGRFLNKATFIGLSIHERRTLGGWGNYSNMAAEVPAKWASVLGDVPPFRASSLDGYIGGAVRDVDEL